MVLGTGCTKESSKPERPLVLLISVDTLRPDHLSCYGYDRLTSPRLDQFAREDAVLFERAFANAPYTLPSHMSMLTGLYPESHGMVLPYVGNDQTRTRRLASEVVTLAERLQLEGFMTAAFTDGGFVSGKYGFDDGFDLFSDERMPRKVENGFRRFGEDLHRWLGGEEQQTSPFFLFVHTFDTHAPYWAPREYSWRFSQAPPGREFAPASLPVPSLFAIHDHMQLEKFEGLEQLVDRYDETIAFVDTEIGKIFDALRAAGRWDDALIIVTSDHGEAFLENGLMIGHGVFVENADVAVPLLIKFPGQAWGGRRVEHVVELVDLLPTVLDAFSLPPLAGLDGQSLVSGVARGEWSKDIAYGVSPNAGGLRYLIRDDFKYIERMDDPTRLLLRAHLGPRNPKKGAIGQKYISKGVRRVYSFSTDPLGVLELWDRGDRLYDVSGSFHEWCAPEIREPAEVLRFRRDALELSRRSAEKQRHLELLEGAMLSSAERSALSELGYIAFVEAATEESPPEPAEETAADVEDPDAPSGDGIEQTPPPVDRRLLHQADSKLWSLLVRYREEGSADERWVDSVLATIRADLDQFLAEHPDRETWVHWRLLSLERARAKLVKEDG